MTLDKVRELLQTQTGIGGLDNSNAAKLTLPEVRREHDKVSIGQLISDLELYKIVGFEPCTQFDDGLAK